MLSFFFHLHSNCFIFARTKKIGSALKRLIKKIAHTLEFKSSHSDEWLFFYLQFPLPNSFLKFIFAAKKQKHKFIFGAAK